MSQKPIAAIVLLSALSLGGCTLFGSESQPVASSPSQAVTAEVSGEIAVSERVEQTEPSAGLQLGAFREPDRASRAVLRLQQQHPIVFENRTPIIRAIERDGTTLYRVILGPFSDTEIARAFCKLLQQRGEACFATQFDRLDIRVDLIANTED